MATTSPHIKPPAQIPFWRDVRVLAIIAQVIFMAAVLAGLGWLIGNFFDNAENQGLNIGFDFLNTTAAFDIKEGIAYSSTDSFGRAIWVGMVNTVWVSVIGIILTTILGIVVGIARLSNNWLLSQIATVYVEIIRNIPLLVVLYFVYFGLFLQLPAVKDSAQVFGLPIYLNQRGAAFPGLTPTIGFPIWLAFIVLAVILVLVLWTIQSRQEEKSGHAANKIATAIVAFLVVVLTGWFVTGSFISDQAIMVSASKNVRDFSGFEAIYLTKIDQNALKASGAKNDLLDKLKDVHSVSQVRIDLVNQIDLAKSAGIDTALLDTRLEIIDNAAIVVCSVENSIGETNAASNLRQIDIPVKVNGNKTLKKATEAYAQGDCDLLAASQAELAAERVVLENPSSYAVLPVNVAPLIMNTPAPSGFNIQGGAKISPEFAALLFGLVIYTGAFASEIVRAGILSVSKGQTEAARALGLNDNQRLRLIVLPQAMRVIIPPMTSQYLNLAKNSSLAVAIAFPDLVSVGNTVINQAGVGVQVIIIFMVSYLLISLVISAFLNWYNQKVALVER